MFPSRRWNKVPIARRLCCIIEVWIIVVAVDRLAFGFLGADIVKRGVLLFGTLMVMDLYVFGHLFNVTEANTRWLLVENAAVKLDISC